MNTDQIKLELSADYQRKVGDFVNREVIYCVSTLVSEIFKAGLNGTFNDADELYAVMAQDDWETAAEDNGYHCEDDDSDSWISDETASIGEGLITWNSAQELCEYLDIDPYQNEALEHWIVSDWFADKLESAGEMILRDFMGLTIWGRTTSGQAIHLDSVICDIYNEVQSPDERLRISPAILKSPLL